MKPTTDLSLPGDTLVSVLCGTCHATTRTSYDAGADTREKLARVQNSHREASPACGNPALSVTERRRRWWQFWV
jgi:hypothetical protein